MATLRLIKPQEPAASMDDAGDERATPAPIEPDRSGSVRIRLDSLPAPLRAVVRDRSEAGITIEAELPWLAVGTAVHADPPDDGGQQAWVQSFDVEVTSTGSARLLIYAGRSPRPRAPVAAGRQRVGRSRWWSRLAIAALVGAAAMTGYSLGRRAAPFDAASGLGAAPAEALR
jgi:hypothetical protein